MNILAMRICFFLVAALSLAAMAEGGLASFNAKRRYSDIHLTQLQSRKTPFWPILCSKRSAIFLPLQAMLRHFYRRSFQKGALFFVAPSEKVSLFTWYPLYSTPVFLIRHALFVWHGPRAFFNSSPAKPRAVEYRSAKMCMKAQKYKPGASTF